MKTAEAHDLADVLHRITAFWPEPYAQSPRHVKACPPATLALSLALALTRAEELPGAM
jgi:hypothetical protein